MSELDGSDRDIYGYGTDYEELCNNCDKHSNKLSYNPPMNNYKNSGRAWLSKNSGYRLTKSSMGKLEEGDEDRCPYNIVDMFGRKFKKDSRTWLHKSSRKTKADTQHINRENIRDIYGDNASPPSQFGIVEHKPPRIEIEEVDDSSSSSESDNPYTIVDSMGRRFKKDSRTWLHKSSSKRKKAEIIEDEEDDVPEFPEIPNTYPADFFLKDHKERDSERKFRETVKTGTDISKKHHSNVLMRKRKQIGNSANYLPDDNQHNAEICMILSGELDETANKPTSIKRSVSFDNIFELFEEVAEDECAECQQLMSNNSMMSTNWRDTKPITSDTSTLSSNENREINHSPLLSDASINLSSDTRIKISTELTSTVKDNNHNKPGSINLMPGVSPVRFNEDQTSNCEQYKSNQTLNVNISRSVTFLIKESDEFLGDAVLSDYEEDSD